ncbi:tRNA 2-thiocytidine biosynthesis protein TtcA [Candidatus Woesearchaeota archaeon]|nr:tRNA 2-thiocytidine biosynthesis protein TtcA [Candidatus Woesearchaeota archaeon]
MRCRLCRKQAVYDELKFCPEHFLKFFEKKVCYYLDRAHIKGSKLLLGVSGGKDSAALAYILSKVKEDYELDISLFSINLQIPDYSEDGLSAVRELAEKTGLPLIVWDLKDYPKIITDFTTMKDRKTGKEVPAKPCSQCGTIKRYLLNKAAVEDGFDYVVTGHNLDDEHYFAMHSLEGGDLVQLLRGDKMLPPKPEQKMAGRLKPLFYLTEKESMIYCLLNDLPVDNKECPYSVGNPQLRFKLERPVSRQNKSNMLKVLRKMKRMISEEE